MAAGTRDLLRTHDIPNSPAGVRYDLREFMGGGTAAHDRKRPTAVALKPDVVIHATRLRHETGSFHYPKADPPSASAARPAPARGAPHTGSTESSRGTASWAAV